MAYKTQMAGPDPGVSDSEELGWRTIIPMSNKLPGYVDTAPLGHFQRQLFVSLVLWSNKSFPSTISISSLPPCPQPLVGYIGSFRCSDSMIETPGDPVSFSYSEISPESSERCFRQRIQNPHLWEAQDGLPWGIGNLFKVSRTLGAEFSGIFIK